MSDRKPVELLVDSEDLAVLQEAASVSDKTRRRGYYLLRRIWAQARASAPRGRKEADLRVVTQGGELLKLSGLHALDQPPD